MHGLGFGGEERETYKRKREMDWFVWAELGIGLGPGLKRVVRR